MTINYVHKLHSMPSKLFLMSTMKRWNGSFVQAAYIRMIPYCILYLILTLIYTLILQRYETLTYERCLYEQLVLAAERQTKDLKSLVALMIGFFVSTVFVRWWSQFKNIANADYIAFLLLGFTSHKEDTEESRKEAQLHMRVVVRYINLAIVETLRTVSARTEKRFRTYDDLVDCGMLTKEEKTIMERVQDRSDKWIKWLPLKWSVNLVNEMKKKKLIDEKGHEKILQEIKYVDSFNYNLKCLVWVNIPIAYTQVVMMLSLTLHLTLVIGSQYISPLSVGECDSAFSTNTTRVTREDFDQSVKNEHNGQIVFQFLQLVFYMGWLAVAKIMINPFGKDADDFETNYLIDRNLQTSLQIVDDNPEDFPPLRDPFENKIPGNLDGDSPYFKVMSKEKGTIKLDQLRGGHK